MKTSDLLRLSLVFMARRKSRTLLTILGVIIGTVCIVLMLSIGYSNYAQFEDMLSSNSALTQITLQTTGDSGMQITDTSIASLQTIEHVHAASGIIELPCTVKTGVYEAVLFLRGIDPDVLDLELAEGTLFPRDSAALMLVLGPDSMRQFINPEDPPDMNDWEAYTQYMPNIDWMHATLMLTVGYPPSDAATSENDLPAGTQNAATVCATISEEDTQNSSSAYISLENARRLLMENSRLAEALNIPVGAYSQAIVRVDDMENVASVQEQIRQMGFDCYSETEYIRDMQAEQSRQQLQLLLIGLISLLVSAIGIANTMYAGILERRRQIGIMKVLGMKIRTIRSLFLTESVLMGLAGGLIGLAVSWIIVAAINAGTAGGANFLGMYFQEGAKIMIPPWVAAGAVAAAVLTGTIAGIWPSSKAAAMSPLEAMRAN